MLLIGPMIDFLPSIAPCIHTRYARVRKKFSKANPVFCEQELLYATEAGGSGSRVYGEVFGKGTELAYLLIKLLRGAEEAGLCHREASQV